MRKGHSEVGEQIAWLQVEVGVIAERVAVLGWYDLSSALHGLCGELDGWNVLVSFERLEEEEARRGQLRLGGEDMGRRHGEPRGDLPF